MGNRFALSESFACICRGGEVGEAISVLFFSISMRMGPLIIITDEFFKNCVLVRSVMYKEALLDNPRQL